MSIALLVPVSLPIAVTKPVQDLYDTIESIPNGSVVFIDSEVGTLTIPEVYPQLISFIKQSIKKNFKFVIGSFIGVECAIITRQALNDLSGELSGYKYGVDYVALGYFPGGQASIAAFGKDIHSLVKTDIDGTPIENLPLMKDLHEAKDFALFMLATSEPLYFIRQIYAPYGGILVSGCDSVGFAASYAYYSSGQLKGLLNGSRGAAEYERLLGYAGKATSLLNIQSFSHLFILGLLITGNIVFWSGKVKKK